MMDDILFLAHRIPFPPDRGDKMRSWHMLRHLAGLGRVHLACFADDEADAAHLGALRAALGGRLGSAHVEVRHANKLVAGLRALATGAPASLTLFDSKRMRRFVNGVMARESIGTVFAFSSQMAQFVPAGPRFVMDFVDMDSAKFADYARTGGAKAWLFRREAERLFTFERATAARADASLFVSEAEAALFRDKAGLSQADIRAVGNGIDLTFYDPAANFSRLEPTPGPLIVFTGQMDYRPNVEAVAHFAATALPRIRAVRPDARFAIVGRNPASAVRELASRDGVVVTGAVDDVRSWLGAADVVVAPLRVARGIQNKVLEAMAMGKPVVASQPAFEGIEALPGRDLLVADDPVEAVTALLADPDRRADMGAAARRRMEFAYRWEARLAPLTEMLRGAERQAAE
ncbi:TIGR03087 family PEP-CTERM/XrtA system glycosyltransferase [Sphingosinicella sp. LY1275]|nr:TIGR03087 family PEP-CTERM/XrtA system glycosyltransferase [Sphingosinicella sp. LY1275]MEA1013568.1 TIGR03087 family PEP-CTERM/XrtA system glycosyltransferase [Sphingosinicella sp. LY1275]